MTIHHVLIFFLFREFQNFVSAAVVVEKDLLMSFYRDTLGPQWIRADNWGSATVPICQWYGVQCRGDSSSNEDVIEISLPRNNVAQRITSIYQLPNLQRLYLPQNPINDPGFEAALYEGKSGSNLASLPSLEVIDLQGCLIQKIRGITRLLPNLQQLLLSHNRLNFFPLEIVESVSANSSATATCCHNLERLDLSFNEIKGQLPSNIGSSMLAISLREFNIHGNFITGTIPSSLAQMKQLETINMGENNWNGAIPVELAQMTTLRVVNLERTDATPAVDNNAVTSNNRLTGPLPSFSRSPELHTLLLGNQALTGTIPLDFLAGSLNDGSVVTIHLQNNQLHGAIPETVFDRFDSLTVVLTPGNQFTGTLPLSFCSHSRWMNGRVGQFGCDAIACPVGWFAAPNGRQITPQPPCIQCSNATTDLPTNSYLGSTSCSGGSVPLISQEQLLAQFYVALNGPRWSKRSGWSDAFDSVLNSVEQDIRSVDFTGLSVCDFGGVFCNSKQQIAILNLPKNGLVGTLPQLFFTLTSLISLDLSDNLIELDDTGFAILQTATGLKRLTLARTRISALNGIQYGAFLTDLIFSGNALETSLPSELFSLSGLSTLKLEACSLTGRIPESISQLTSLKTLYFDQNELTGSLPESIAQLEFLEEVDLSFNALHGELPLAFNNMSSLKILRLNDERGNFGGTLLSFESLTRITELDLTNNHFNGTIPANFLTSLSAETISIIKLSNNQLEGSIPVSMSKFSSMTLELDNNIISGIPDIICENEGWMGGEVGRVPDKCDAILCPPGTWSQLGRANVQKHIVCSRCNSSIFYGATYCGNEAKLQSNLEVRILDQLFEATNGRFWTQPHTNWTRPYVPICLREGVRCSKETPDLNSGVFELVLHNFGLRGTIPSEIFDLPYIRGLGFFSNQVNISLERIGNAKNLQTLRLSSTHVRTLDGIENAGAFLSEIFAENNGIKGSFPTGLLYLGSLRGLYLGGNLLSGTIPSEIGRLKNLRALRLADNRFVGFLPSELSSLSELVQLYIQRNRLSGLLPSSFNNFTKLELLDLSDQSSLKKLTGPLLAFSSSPQIREISLNNNRLVGKIPSTFLDGVDKTTLIKVNLAYNEISGSLPETLSSFDRLNIFLASNMINNVPEVLCKKVGWMDGRVGTVREEDSCNVILCPPGMFATDGRQSGVNEPCGRCSSVTEAPYFGATACTNPNSLAVNSCMTTDALPFVDSACNVTTTERGTLELFFATTGGGGWINSSRWLTDSPICSWEGIVCTGDSHDSEGVEMIELADNSLSGVLPIQLWNLPSLRRLNLRGNKKLLISFVDGSNILQLEELLLSDTIVLSLEHLTRFVNLVKLEVSGIAGIFPQSILLLPRLERLLLGGNMFVGTLPNKIFELSRLKQLDVSGSDFFGPVKIDFGHLPDLEELVLDENQLTSLPVEQLSSTLSLVRLSIARRLKVGRKLYGSLPSFAKAPLLEYLALDGNELSGSIPNTFLSISTSIMLVNLSHNSLTGSIPDSLNSTLALDLLVADNRITYLPRELCKNSNWMNGAVSMLQSCSAILCPPETFNPAGRAINESSKCEQCSSVGSVPSPYLGRTSCSVVLEERSLLLELYDDCNGHNWFRHEFWGSTANVCDWYGVGCINGSVVLLNLDANNLQGTPPTSLFRLINLQILLLGSNSINFRFDDIGQAQNLMELRLAGIGLSSLKGVGEAKTLTVLDLSFNKLNGHLTGEILQLSNFRVLNLRDNAIERLPDTLVTLKYLRVLRLDNNALVGSVPILSDLSALSFVFLGSNSLNGTIPSNFLEHVTINLNMTVDLSMNSITGTIPEELKRFENMRLYLRDNQISGIHEAVCSQTNWMDGEVGSYGCDAILCRPGFTTLIGRHGKQTPAGCVECVNTSNTFGSSTCQLKISPVATSGQKRLSIIFVTYIVCSATVILMLI